MYIESSKKLNSVIYLLEQCVIRLGEAKKIFQATYNNNLIVTRDE